MKKIFEYIKGMTAIAGLLTIAASCTEDDLGPLRNPVEQVTTEYTWAATADSMQTATYNTYLTSNGTFQQDNEGSSDFFHYWWNAHMLDVLTDGYIRTEDGAYLSRMKALVQGIKVRNGNKYQNEFNDDMEWLGIACVRAYEVTNDDEYLNLAKELWNEVKKGWSDEFGGGIQWKTDTPLSKNACSNAPGAILALGLYRIEENPEDLEWAKDIYDWQKSTLVDPVTGLVWDNISREGGEITINKDWIFTYNQGSYIGAAHQLYEATNEQVYLSDAIKTSNAIMTSPKVTTEGVLRNENQGDGGLFKGILVRYFTDLIQEPDLADSDREKYVEFLQFNAETFYSRGISRPSMLSSPDWRSQPGATIDLSTQLSGVMLIEAAAKLDEDGLLK